jgi:hypothetical protein
MFFYNNKGNYIVVTVTILIYIFLKSCRNFPNKDCLSIIDNLTKYLKYFFKK